MAASRRTLIAGGAAAAAAATSLTPWLAGCRAKNEPSWTGGWVGADAQRGHRLRGDASPARPGAAGPTAAPPPARDAAATTRTTVAIVGAGVAGLAAARALQRAGVDDLLVLELEDVAGGNARAHTIDAHACPLGAHYLPVPGDTMPELREWLAEIGLMRHRHGRWHADARHLCHAPQERLWFDGEWVEGLLPPAAKGSSREAQYRRFGVEVDALARQAPFAMPAIRAPWRALHEKLDAVTFARWLRERGFDDEALLGFLDYACRDDYGAGIATVSAWAGLHYFASRHGFVQAADVPSSPGGVATDAGVFTWPEGNAWLTQRLAQPLRERAWTGVVVTRVEAGRHDVVIDAHDARADTARRIVARHAIVAVPLHVARRIVHAPGVVPDIPIVQAPWLVANLHLRTGLDDRAGAAPAWDNVLFARAGASDALGYVDAAHQSLSPLRDGRVVTAYWALGRDGGHGMRAARQALLDEPWQTWAARVVDDLVRAHPDLPAKVTRVDLTRYGHAMAIPTPTTRTQLQAALGRSLHDDSRVRLAHADLAGYSVFEEAFAFGHDAGVRVARCCRPGRSG
jgi:monoamine oxidase